MTKAVKRFTSSAVPFYLGQKEHTLHSRGDLCSHKLKFLSVRVVKYRKWMTKGRWNSSRCFLKIEVLFTMLRQTIIKG